MRVTILTSNHPRHLYLIKSLQKISKELLAIIEPKPYIRNTKLKYNKLIKNYFKNVKNAENKIFNKCKIIKNNNTEIYIAKRNEINFNELKKNKIFLNSNYYIVFGSSIIKNKMLSYLLRKKALNIHMGISPYYRGTDCNFWAIYDGFPNYVGGTVMKLSKKIDAGKILFTSRATKQKNKFNFMMSSCKNVIDDLTKYLKNKTKLNFKNNPLKKCIRYSKRKDFTVKNIKKFLDL